MIAKLYSGGGVLPSCAIGMAVLLCASSAGAKEKEGKEKKVCTAAYVSYKSAQEREQSGHQREARDLLTTCSQSTCAGVAQKCTTRLAQLNADMPSVVPVVTDESGAPKCDVQVKVDGEMLTSKIDGKGLPVEPGLHEFSFGTDSGVFATQKVLVVEGQRNRPIMVSLRAPGSKAPAANAAPGNSAATPVEATAEAAPVAPADSSAEPDSAPKAALEPTPASDHPARRRTLLPYVIGAAGLAAVGGGALLTYWGKKDNDELNACSPHCSQAGVDHVRTMYVAADISFGAGILALGAATYLFATTHPADDKPAPRAAYQLDVQPTRSGAFASVTGAF